MEAQSQYSKNLNKSQAIRLTSAEIDARYLIELSNLRQQAANKPRVLAAISALIRRKAQRVITET